MYVYGYLCTTTMWCTHSNPAVHKIRISLRNEPCFTCGSQRVPNHRLLIGQIFRHPPVLTFISKIYYFLKIEEISPGLDNWYFSARTLCGMAGWGGCGWRMTAVSQADGGRGRVPTTARPLRAAEADESVRPILGGGRLGVDPLGGREGANRQRSHWCGKKFPFPKNLMFFFSFKRSF